MQLLCTADDGIHRARLNAQRAADAARLIDDGNRAGTLNAVFRVQRQGRCAEQFGKACNAFFAAGRALIDVGIAVCNGLGVVVAARVAALRTLGLRGAGLRSGLRVVGRRGVASGLHGYWGKRHYRVKWKS